MSRTLEPVAERVLSTLAVEDDLRVEVCDGEVKQAVVERDLALRATRCALEQSIKAVDVRSDKRLRRGILWADAGRVSERVLALQRVERSRRPSHRRWIRLVRAREAWHSCASVVAGAARTEKLARFGEALGHF